MVSDEIAVSIYSTPNKIMYYLILGTCYIIVVCCMHDVDDMYIMILCIVKYYYFCQNILVISISSPLVQNFVLILGYARLR